MKIISKILRSEHFINKPPVLLDIGASGEINQKWRAIAPYSICLAYDADDREFHVTEEIDKNYKKLITFNRIVTAEPVEEAPFYLTRSPFCSSLLEPDKSKLDPWIFSHLFDVERVRMLPATTVGNSLRLSGIGYIDWFKTDTQGTDLRLFTSLPADLQSGILATEFEPGIIDAYAGEDKLYTVMQEMHKKGFWLSSMELRGVQRLHAGYAQEFGSFMAKRALRNTPGWAEVTYLRQPESVSQRQLLLLYVFALLEKQYGFALEITDLARKKYRDPLFDELRETALKKIKAESLKSPLVVLKRQFNKIFRSINN